MPSLDCVDPSKGEGELASDEEEPDLNQGDPNLDQLMLTEDEQKDFESFPLASLSISLQKGIRGVEPLYGRS